MSHDTDQPSSRFPLYELKEGDRRSFVTLAEAAWVTSYEEGELGPRCIDANGIVRNISESERTAVRTFNFETTAPAGKFPLYEMMVNGTSEFHPYLRAVRVFDSGLAEVHFGELVIEGSGWGRQFTSSDRAKIADAADEYSAGK